MERFWKESEEKVKEVLVHEHVENIPAEVLSEKIIKELKKLYDIKYGDDGK